MLLDKGINSSTQVGIIRDFDEHYKDNNYIPVEKNFSDLVLQINKNEPSEDFATEYLEAATDFMTKIKAERETLTSI